MRMNRLGNSDLIVSAVGAGTWAMGGDFFGTTDDKKCVDSLCASLDHGVNLIDTAPIYGRGHSEELVGKAIKGRRDKVVLATKVGLAYGAHPNGGKGRCLKPEGIAWEIEQSLRRLGTDYIDLYYIHWPNADIAIEETMEAFGLLKQQGKIRAIGVSNFNKAQMEAVCRCAQLDGLQPEYNLLTRGIEAEDLPFCAENDVAVLTYNSIAKGILSGAFHFGGKVVTDFRTAKPLFQPDALQKETPLLTLLRDVAADHGVTLSQVAIAASLAHAGVSSTIVGTQNEQHFLDNLAAAELVLTEAELTAIDETSARVIAAL